MVHTEAFLRLFLLARKFIPSPDALELELNAVLEQNGRSLFLFQDECARVNKHILRTKRRL